MSKILAVDDSIVSLEIVKAYLATVGGHEVDLAFSSEAAKQRLLRNRYDLLLFDYRIAVMDGLQLLQWCREAKIFTPCIINSAVDPADLRELELKAVESKLSPVVCLSKIPEKRDQLLTTIALMTKVKERS